MKKLLLFGLMTCAMTIQAEPVVDNENEVIANEKGDELMQKLEEAMKLADELKNAKTVVGDTVSAQEPSKKRLAARLLLQTAVPLVPFLALKGYTTFKRYPSDDDKFNALMISAGMTLFGWVELFNQNVKDSYAIAKSCMSADQTESRIARYAKKVGAGIAALVTASVPVLINVAALKNQKIFRFLQKCYE
ncbi:hypothetical protein IPH25_00420 [bacterium]|nr:MAG: hypothetical protein IPG37_02535 [bacterium]QQR61898.1 MAG: hypothetical protein IPH25_00420 [bacterium]